MPGHMTENSQHWRDRAAQMRALALTMNDPEVVAAMTNLAADYDKLAQRAAAKTAKSPLIGGRSSSDNNR